MRNLYQEFREACEDDGADTPAERFEALVMFTMELRYDELEEGEIRQVVVMCERLRKDLDAQRENPLN